MTKAAVSADPLLGKKNYTFSAKTNASKEIESWGRDYGSLTGAMRSAGQLTDNVTEARLLQNRIMEMSRDRYKYITQADTNKKFFLNGQQRKTRLMPRLLQGVDIDYWMSKKTTRHVPTFSSSSNNARFAFLNRLEKQGEKCKDFDEEENPFDMPSSRPVRPSDQPKLPEFYRIRLKEQEEAEMAKTTFPTQPILRPQTHKTVEFCKTSKQNQKLPDVLRKSASLTRESTFPSTSHDKKVQIAQRRVQSSGVSNTRCVDDPRYRTLERSLSVTYKKPEELDPQRVQSIINAQDSLHVPSKQNQNSKPKLQKTILEYLRARGFDV